MASEDFSININTNIGGLGQVERMDRSMIGLTGTTDSLRSSIRRAVGVFAAFKTLSFVRDQIQETVEAAIRFEEQVAEVSKLVGEFRGGQMAAVIRDMAREIPVAREKIAGVIEDAARLGVRGAENIEHFTETILQMEVATDISAEEAATSFARIISITDATIQEVDVLGATVNRLANTMAVTTQEVVDSMLRASAAMTRFGLTSRQISVLSASLVETSASARRAGTRLRRFFQQLMDPARIEGLSQALGITTDRFREIRETSPLQLVKDLAQSFREGGEAARMIASEVDTSTQQALAGLSLNLEGVNEALENTSSEQEVLNSLYREFNVRAGTTASRTELLRNRMEALRTEVGTELLPAYSFLVETFLEFSRAINIATNGLSDFRREAEPILGTSGFERLGGQIASLREEAMASSGTDGLFRDPVDVLGTFWDDLQEGTRRISEGQVFKGMGDIVLGGVEESFEEAAKGTFARDMVMQPLVSALDGVQDAQVIQEMTDAYSDALSEAQNQGFELFTEEGFPTQEYRAFLTAEINKALEGARKEVQDRSRAEQLSTALTETILGSLHGIWEEEDVRGEIQSMIQESLEGKGEFGRPGDVDVGSFAGDFRNQLIGRLREGMNPDQIKEVIENALNAAVSQVELSPDQMLQAVDVQNTLEDVGFFDFEARNPLQHFRSLLPSSEVQQVFDEFLQENRGAADEFNSVLQETGDIFKAADAAGLDFLKFLRQLANRIQGSTEETEEFKDALEDLQETAVPSIAEQISQLTGLPVAQIERLRELTESTDTLSSVERQLDQAIEDLRDAISVGMSQDTIEAARQEVKDLQRRRSGLIPDVDLNQGRTSRTTEDFEDMAETQEQFDEMMNEIRVDEFEDKMQRFRDALDLEENIGEFADFWIEAGGGIADFVSEIEQANPAVEGFADENDLLRESLIALEGGLDRLPTNVNEVEKALQGLPEENREALLEFFGLVQDESESMLSGIREATEGFGREFSQTLPDVILDDEQNWESAGRQLGESFVSSLIEVVTQRLITAPLLDVFLGKDFMSGVEGAGIGGVAGGVSDWIGSWFSDTPGIMEARNGTPVRFKDGDKFAAAQSMAGLRSQVGGGDGDANVQVNVVNETNGDVQHQQRQQGGIEIHDIVVSEASGDIRRGGSLDTTLKNTYGLQRQGRRS